MIRDHQNSIFIKLCSYYTLFHNRLQSKYSGKSMVSIMEMVVSAGRHTTEDYYIFNITYNI